MRIDMLEAVGRLPAPFQSIGLPSYLKAVVGLGPRRWNTSKCGVRRVAFRHAPCTESKALIDVPPSLLPRRLKTPEVI